MKYLLTDAGAELLADLGVTGEGLHLTRAQAGEGYSDAPEGLTALMSGQLDMQIADLERQGAITTLTLLATNHTLQEDRRVQQIGIFARGGEDAGEVLFIVGQDQNGDVLPSMDYGRVEYRYTINLKISNAQNIILDINDTDFVLKKVFRQQVGEVDVLGKGNLQEQIDRVTAAVDEKIMKYLGTDGEDGDLGFTEGLDAKNVVDAVNKVFISGSEKKAQLAENLTAMGVASSADETWEQLLDKVLAMTDVSGDTVTAPVLLTGYTAHDASGEQISGDMPEMAAVTVDAILTTQDSEYTYLEMPEGHYSEDSKVRTKNSNIQRIVNLGTGTSFNVTSYAGYQNFTASNFIIEFVGVNSSRGTELQSGWDDLPNFGAHSGIETSASGLSKSYNPTTGILSVSAATVSRVMGDHWQYEKGRVTASITLRAYLII